jgi:hypothetical protein
MEIGANMPVYGYELGRGSIFILEYWQTKWVVTMRTWELQILVLGNSIHRGLRPCFALFWRFSSSLRITIISTYA